MKELIITGEDSYIEKLKVWLEDNCKSTKGKMWIRNKASSNGLKDQIRKISNETKRTFKPIGDVMKKIDDDLKKVVGDF